MKTTTLVVVFILIVSPYLCYSQSKESIIISNPEQLIILNNYKIGYTTYENFMKDFVNAYMEMAPFSQGKYRPAFSLPDNELKILSFDISSKGKSIDDVLSGKNASGIVKMGFLEERINNLRYCDVPERFVLVSELKFTDGILESIIINKKKRIKIKEKKYALNNETILNIETNESYIFNVLDVFCASFEVEDDVLDTNMNIIKLQININSDRQQNEKRYSRKTSSFYQTGRIRTLLRGEILLYDKQKDYFFSQTFNGSSINGYKQALLRGNFLAELFLLLVDKVEIYNIQQNINEDFVFKGLTNDDKLIRKNFNAIFLSSKLYYDSHVSKHYFFKNQYKISFPKFKYWIEHCNVDNKLFMIQFLSDTSFECLNYLKSKVNEDLSGCLEFIILERLVTLFDYKEYNNFLRRIESRSQLKELGLDEFWQYLVTLFAIMKKNDAKANTEILNVVKKSDYNQLKTCRKFMPFLTNWGGDTIMFLVAYNIKNAVYNHSVYNSNFYQLTKNNSDILLALMLCEYSLFKNDSKKNQFGHAKISAEVLCFRTFDNKYDDLIVNTLVQYLNIKRGRFIHDNTIEALLEYTTHDSLIDLVKNIKVPLKRETIEYISGKKYDYFRQKQSIIEEGID